MLSFDIILLGCGLHCGLAALALASERPRLRVAVVEAESRVGGNHLWSFHAADAPEPTPTWLAPLITYHWPCHEVRFPGYRRVIAARYRTMTSDRLHDAVTSRYGESGTHRIFLGRRALTCTPHRVVLDDGTELGAALVLDGRGLDPDSPLAGSGFQKFCGLELVLGRPHSFTHPVLMDAEIEQLDGFRFMYLLPFSNVRLFVEDTYFSDSPTLDSELVARRVREYADRLGLQVERVARRESGVLPMPWIEHPSDPDGLPALGVRGGWYHPATAYSVPAALRNAAIITRADSPAQLRRALLRARRRHRRQARFARLLNRMLFQCFAPEMRVHVFENFYRLPEATIRRFYALDMTAGDRVRMLVGRPPRGFSLGRALHIGEAGP